METFVSKDYYNSYVLSEAAGETMGECLSIVDFLGYLDIILEYSDEQSAKFRKLYANADGTAGEKIHEYTVTLLRRARNE